LASWNVTVSRSSQLLSKSSAATAASIGQAPTGAVATIATPHLLATSFSEVATATGYALFVNGELFAEGSLGRGEPAVSLEIPASLLGAGENSIRIYDCRG